MAKQKKKSRKQEQDRVITAQVVGVGAGIILFLIGVVLLFYVLGTNGMEEIQSLIQ